MHNPISTTPAKYRLSKFGFTMRRRFNSGSKRQQQCYRVWLLNVCWQLQKHHNRGSFTWPQLTNYVGCRATCKWLFKNGFIVTTTAGG